MKNLLLKTDANMKARKVILFTRRFPYFKTEAFLEAEINILAEAFDEVVIFPSEISEEVRPILANVKVEKEFSKHFQNKKKRILQTIFSSFFWDTLWKYKSKINSADSFKHIFQFSSSVIAYKTYFKNYEFSESDLLYTYWFTEATKAFIDLKKTKKFKLVSRAHRYDIYEGLPSTPAFWPFRKDVLEKIDKLYSISENGKNYMETKYKVYNKIKVSKLGVFDKGKTAPQNVENEISFVSVSRIDPMKRVQLIADSIVNFAKLNPEKKITWIHFGDGKERENIKNSIPVLSNLKAQLNGAIQNTQIYKYYEENPVSIFINLSSSEGIPVSIMEAQSFGIPVIATDVGGSGEIVQNETGKLLSANPSVSDVNLAINQILSENLSRQEIKKFWNLNFNAQTNYENFVNDLKSEVFLDEK
ncbi:glycosyltransferase [Chryseobacterium sp. G0240]|uniref:glycosyltransferase n=1 Tax=Chryseobacterium sp. G0240 TaxID=2487066 RepID=UPI000F45BDCD|nr:glycosyltransferase [Chryseobacterium sp. G0240]ROI02643.1 glycosyltransferase [Chryseobacterium sp. G0240]